MSKESLKVNQEKCRGDLLISRNTELKKFAQKTLSLAIIALMITTLVKVKSISAQIRKQNTHLSQKFSVAPEQISEINTMINETLSHLETVKNYLEGLYAPPKKTKEILLKIIVLRNDLHNLQTVLKNYPKNSAETLSLVQSITKQITFLRKYNSLLNTREWFFIVNSVIFISLILNTLVENIRTKPKKDN